MAKNDGSTQTNKVHKLVVYQNNDGAFSEVWSIVEEKPPQSVEWADWDNDNDLDLAVGNEGGPVHLFATEGISER